MTNRLLRFAVVGTVGFSVDAAVFSLCFYLGQYDPITSRAIAFFCAASATWYGNRRFTFADRDQQVWQQWAKFLSVAMVSAIPNFVVFKVVYLMLGASGFGPMLALGAGVLAGMTSNYTISRRWVFNPS